MVTTVPALQNAPYRASVVQTKPGQPALFMSDPWTRWVNQLYGIVQSLQPGGSAGLGNVTAGGTLGANQVIIGAGGQGIAALSNGAAQVGWVLTFTGPGVAPVWAAVAAGAASLTYRQVAAFSALRAF